MGHSGYFKSVKIEMGLESSYWNGSHSTVERVFIFFIYNLFFLFIVS